MTAPLTNPAPKTTYELIVISAGAVGENVAGGPATFTGNYAGYSAARSCATP